jgi:predicted glycoside hydrolase/deacetylase ChbG (UPF0249 family)
MEVRIHADDLGATRFVDRSILAVWSAGGLDGASVLANGDSIAETARQMRDAPYRLPRIRVHLNLSEGRPLPPWVLSLR